MWLGMCVCVCMFVVFSILFPIQKRNQKIKFEFKVYDVDCLFSLLLTPLYVLKNKIQQKCKVHKYPFQCWICRCGLINYD